MQTCTMVEPGKSLRKVNSEGQPTLIASNGKPQSIVINVSGLPVNETVSLAQEPCGQHCIRQPHSMSHERGLDGMAEEDIRVETDASRAGIAGFLRQAAPEAVWTKRANITISDRMQLETRKPLELQDFSLRRAQRVSSGVLSQPSPQQSRTVNPESPS